MDVPGKLESLATQRNSTEQRRLISTGVEQDAIDRPGDLVMALIQSQLRMSIAKIIPDFSRRAPIKIPNQLLKTRHPIAGALLQLISIREDCPPGRFALAGRLAGPRLSATPSALTPPMVAAQLFARMFFGTSFCVIPTNESHARTRNSLLPGLLGHGLNAQLESLIRRHQP